VKVAKKKKPLNLSAGTRSGRKRRSRAKNGETRVCAEKDKLKKKPHQGAPRAEDAKKKGKTLMRGPRAKTVVTKRRAYLYGKLRPRKWGGAKGSLRGEGKKRARATASEVEVGRGGGAAG